MIVPWRERPGAKERIILVQKKGDSFPGFPGGKIETLLDNQSNNVDPISCCIAEGAEELGFDIIPLQLIGVGVTPLHMRSENDYNSLVNYCFLGAPKNPLKVQDALKNPRKYLEDKMEKYVLLSKEELREIALDDELRTPDMRPLYMLYLTSDEHSPFGGPQHAPLGVFSWAGLL